MGTLLQTFKRYKFLIASILLASAGLFIYRYIESKEVYYPANMEACIAELNVPYRIQKDSVFVNIIYEIKVTSYCA